tara:strand:+ start:25028 stop:25468 length:441 start_codon:yes stop_codon:yes gene_type:complete
MQSVNRLVRICCYYNKVKFADFYNLYSNVRIKDTRSIVYHILKTELGLNTYQISELFNKPVEYVEDHIKYHYKEYDIINHYKKIYENTITQFRNWNNTDLDLAYSIVKSKYDVERENKYEQILNDNNRLEHEIDILKIKLNKKSYV